MLAFTVLSFPSYKSTLMVFSLEATHPFSLTKSYLFIYFFTISKFQCSVIIPFFSVLEYYRFSFTSKGQHHLSYCTVPLSVILSFMCWTLNHQIFLLLSYFKEYEMKIWKYTLKVLPLYSCGKLLIVPAKKKKKLSRNRYWLDHCEFHSYASPMHSQLRMTSALCNNNETQAFT